MTPEEKADFVKQIEETIETIIVGRKLKYMETTPEFIAGLLVGMEIAGLHGDKIKELYGNPIAVVD